MNALLCVSCRETVKVMPDGSYYCRGCRLPVEEVRPLRNGDQPQESSVHSAHPKDEVERTELSLLWATDLEPLAEGETESLWPPFIPPASNTLVSGDSGVGKTTFFYNWAIHAAKGEEFVGIPFPRPLRVLYVDLETPDNLRRTKLNVISSGERPDGLAFMTSIDFMEDNLALARIVKQYSFDVVIVDTISAAFRTAREDDNAEANAQSRAIREVIALTGATIIQLQHIGKSEVSKKVYKARGASARPASADVVLNLETVSDDTVKLEMVKNRWVGGIEKLFLLKAGEDQFEVTEVDGDKGIGETIKAQEWLQSWGRAKYPEAVRYKDIAESSPFPEGTTRRALSGLVQTGQVQKPKRGHYLFFCSFNPNYRVDQNEQNGRNLLQGKDQLVNGVKPSDGPLVHYAVEELGMKVTGRSR